MKKNDYTNLTPQELEDKVKDLRKQLMELSFKKSTAQVEKPHFFKQIRKDIARILTVLQEKKR